MTLPPFPAADAWQASWIEPIEPDDGLDAHRPAYHLAGEVTVDGPVESAVLHATAHGVYEALLNGRQVVDFGQNSNGWARLTDLGPVGTTITLTYGEALDPTTGDVTQANIEQGSFAASRPVPLPFQTDVVTSAGDGRAFEPRHSTKGFQYVRVEGHPGPLDPGSITSASSTPTSLGSAVSRAPTSASTACTTPLTGASAETPATSPLTAPPGSGPGGLVTGSSTSTRPRTSTTSPTGR